MDLLGEGEAEGGCRNDDFIDNRVRYFDVIYISDMDREVHLSGEEIARPLSIIQ